MAIQGRIGIRSGVEWINLFGEEPECGHQSADELRSWARKYLTEPNSELGRDGPVCPFVRPSIAKQMFGAAFVHGSELDPDTLRVIVSDQFEIYLGMVESDVKDQALMTLVTVFPDLVDYTVIDAVHSSCKPRFVDRGLMLGQFYPGCSQPGLWNHDFRPLDAPLPMLVARSMMTTDFPFLIARQEWLRAYFKKFAPRLPTTLRSNIAKCMAYDGDAVAAITEHRKLVGNVAMQRTDVNHE